MFFSTLHNRRVEETAPSWPVMAAVTCLSLFRKLADADAPPDLEQYEDASGQRDCEDGSGQLAEVLAAKAV
jgi:hypothetical protein